MRKRRLTKSYKSQARQKRAQEKLKREVASFFGVALMGVAILFLSAINLIDCQRKPEVKYTQVVLGSKDNLDKRIEFWQAILEKTPDYLPGIIEMIKIENARGNIQEASSLLKRAEELNPNYPKLKEIKSRLAKQLP